MATTMKRGRTRLGAKPRLLPSASAPSESGEVQTAIDDRHAHDLVASERGQTRRATKPTRTSSALAPGGESSRPDRRRVAIERSPGGSPSAEVGEVHTRRETQCPVDPAASADGSGTIAIAKPEAIPSAPALGHWPDLRMVAETLVDYQQMRIAIRNRVDRAPIDSEMLTEQLGKMEGLEKDIAKVLVGEYRRAVPPAIRRWQAETVGLGEHTFARLLGQLGHPRHATPYRWVGKGKKRHLVADPPYERGVGQLWSYCGVGDPNRRRRSGMDVEDALACGSPRLRSLLFVISECCVKQRHSPYRKVYDEARVVYATRQDVEGTAWPLTRQHAAALRKVAKEILRDLWVVAG